MTPEIWLENKFGHEKFHGDFNRFYNIFHSLKLEINSKVVTVAGTNGKGQTSRILSQIFLENNKTTALWTSPHLLSVTERFNLNGSDISSEELLEIFKETESLLGHKVSQISYFEFLFCSFMYLCSKKKIEYIVLEAGLGGRLDATNVVDADLVLITSISRDHQSFLGNRYDKILSEKICLTRRSKGLITSFTLDYLDQITGKYCEKNSINWSKLTSKEMSFAEANYELALRASRNILASEPVMPKKQKMTDLACRLRYSSSFNMDFYPSHNPDGFRKLFHLLVNKTYNKVVISFSKRPQEDLIAMIKMAKRFSPSGLSLCFFQASNSCEWDVLKRLGSELSVNTYKSYSEFIDQQLSPGQNVLATGSNYFIADFYKYLVGPSRR